MSKAFTRESDDKEDDLFPSVRPQLGPGVNNYITRRGAERLRARLEELLARRKSETASEQRRLEASIRKLQSALASAVVAESPADKEKAAFGASVTVQYRGGEREEYQIVGVDEADPSEDRISWVSPLARALLNCKVGDVVKFRSPGGEMELTIISLRHDAQ